MTLTGRSMGCGLFYHLAQLVSWSRRYAVARAF